MKYLVELQDLQDLDDAPNGLEPRKIIKAQRAFQILHLPADLGDDLVAALLALNRDDLSGNLASFYTEYVLPYGVFYVYLSLLKTLGYNVRSNGVVEFNDTQNNSRPVSVSARGDIIQDKREQMNAYRMRMLRRFSKLDQTIDGTKYGLTAGLRRSRPTAGINAIGDVNNRIRTKPPFRL